MIDFKILKLFSHPIFCFKLENFQSVNIELLKFIYDEQKNDPEGINRSNVHGWHSKNFDLSKESPARSFGLNLQKYLQVVFSNYGWPFKDNIVKLAQMWAIINKKNSFNKAHIHPNNYLSSAYYVKAPKGCGNIKFYNPNEVSRNRFPSGTKSTEFSANLRSIEPEEGDLLIFPSYLYHSVDANISDEDRVIISFNVDIAK